jgi:hypothetical protein
MSAAKIRFKLKQTKRETAPPHEQGQRAMVAAKICNLIYRQRARLAKRQK